MKSSGVHEEKEAALEPSMMECRRNLFGEFSESSSCFFTMFKIRVRMQLSRFQISLLLFVGKYLVIPAAKAKDIKKRLLDDKT
jgi:hypothetical protein